MARRRERLAPGAWTPQPRTDEPTAVAPVNIDGEVGDVTPEAPAPTPAVHEAPRAVSVAPTRATEPAAPPPAPVAAPDPPVTAANWAHTTTWPGTPGDPVLRDLDHPLVGGVRGAVSGMVYDYGMQKRRDRALRRAR